MDFSAEESSQLSEEVLLCPTEFLFPKVPKDLL